MATGETWAKALVYNFPHSIDTVYKEIISADYLTDRATWVTTDEVTVTEEPKSGGGVTIKLDRYVSRNYPKALKGLFPAKQQMDHTEHWVPDGENWKGSYHVDVIGAPVLVEAEYTLTKQGSGCQLEIIHTITAKIPLLGKRVEKYILGQSRNQFGDQLKFLDLRLAGVPNLLPRDVNKYPLP